MLGNTSRLIENLIDKIWDMNTKINQLEKRIGEIENGNKRAVLGESDRSDEHEIAERNRTKKHALWT